MWIRPFQESVSLFIVNDRNSLTVDQRKDQDSICLPTDEQNSDEND